MDVPLSKVPGIGPKRLIDLQAAGIETVRRLLLYLPVDYRDMSETRALDTLCPGETAAVRVTVVGAVSDHRAKRVHVTRCRVTDGTATMYATWYNQPWIRQTLLQADELLLYAHVEVRDGKPQLTSPILERETGIIPVYKNVGSIPGKVFGTIVQAALKLMDGQWPDELPESVRRRHDLCERNFAMHEAHMPQSREALAAARRRLSFEELLLYQVALRMLRSGKGHGVAIPCAQKDGDAFWKNLPFSPTGAQRKVLDEILEDMARPNAMARLVQGDVGSGKTAVALAALAVAAQYGYQGALMAPTEVLARQHFESAGPLFEKLQVSCGLLTGSMTEKEKKRARDLIASGAWRVAIGTHALISETVEYQNLGLVVTDEQHRFGVRQRTQLQLKGDSPNVLVMSATPIPRTLALILYGDLDVSVIDEMPPGRMPVRTRVVPEEKRRDMYAFVENAAKEGLQTYVVCPLIEESEALDARPAEAIYQELRDGALKNLRVGLAHGRMKSEELARVLDAFRAHELDVLVSTTVIEVGVNVPTAAIMIVENAERFGLAQLHQLRGRVGRGAAQSWCFLMSDKCERLETLVKTGDGFEIARKDLELRGAGDVFGSRQSGMGMEGLAMLAPDTRLLKEAHDEARRLMQAPDSEDTKRVKTLSMAAFENRFREIAFN